MQVQEVDYPVSGKRKFIVTHNGKRYTCYKCCFSGDLVVFGDGNSESCKDITETKLGAEILLACG